MRRALWGVVGALALASWAVAATPSLRIVFIDVEGGQATLVVTPAGQSLLIDTGYAGNDNRDAARIATAARSAGVKKIDYVLLTHYHPDHTGGVPQLLKVLPVGGFIDHGALERHDTGTQQAWQAYQDVLAAGHYIHLSPSPGDVLPLKGVTATVVATGERTLRRNLAGGGAPNPDCGIPDHWTTDTSENAYSMGVLIRYGRFTFLDLGDLPFGEDRQLVCPDNRLGTVSVYLLAHHGTVPSSSHALTDGVHPEVVIVDNGPHKGGAAAALDMVKATPGLRAMWQLHYADASGASNTTPAQIVNLQGADAGLPLALTARSDGSFILYNPRTQATASYPSR